MAITAVCAFLFFYGLGVFGLVGPDEPRYAQVAREMFERNDLITPTLNGEPWLEKPALYYWRAMFAYELFGVDDWVARLPSATIAFAMVLIIYVHMRRFRPGAQLDAALITASAAAVIGFSRGASTDMQLAAPFAISMLGWYAWYETRKKIWLVDFYFFLALATLAKGPVGLALAGFIIGLFILYRRDATALRQTLWFPGVLLYLAVMLPWYIAVQVQNPEFFRVFLLEHNFLRFTTETYSHIQPWWYYVPVFFLSLVPWSFLAGIALWDAARNVARESRLPKERLEPVAEAFPEFLLIWLAVPLIFFSISSAKLPGYILPSIPPATILIADYLRRSRYALPGPVVVAHSLMLATLLGLALMLPSLMLFPGQLPPRNTLFISGVAAGVFAAFAYLALRYSQLRLLRFVTLLPVVLSMAFIMRLGGPIADTVYSTRPIARQVQQAAGTAPVAVYNVHRATEYGLNFYRAQRLPDYDDGEIPAAPHLVISRHENIEELRRIVGERRVTIVGSYPAQHLTFFWVAGT